MHNYKSHAAPQQIDENDENNMRSYRNKRNSMLTSKYGTLGTICN